MKIVIFGDSITNGYDYSDHSSSTLLKESIEKASADRISVNLQGVNGENTTDCLVRIPRVLAENADKVLVFFGANDAAKHDPTTIEQFRENLAQIVEQIGADRVILLTPPYHDDRYQRDDRSNSLVENYAAVTKAVAKSYQLPLIDVYSAMTVDSNPNVWLQHDGLHFSPLGYEKLGQLIADSLISE